MPLPWVFLFFFLFFVFFLMWCLVSGFYFSSFFSFNEKVSVKVLEVDLPW